MLILVEGGANLGDKGRYHPSLPDRWKAAHPVAVREYREQERRDKADTAVLQAARRRVRAERRKDK
jgi:hypothetical protein